MKMKTIVIARHAKSDWATGLPDHDRPLNARGKADSPKMARALKALEFMPDLILSSSAVRARTTAETIAKGISYTGEVRIDPKLYETGHGMIVGMLQNLPSDVHQVMIFGHNPILENLAAYLLQMSATITIPTSGMVAIETPIREWSSLKPGDCSLLWFLIPKLLD